MDRKRLQKQEKKYCLFKHVTYKAHLFKLALITGNDIISLADLSLQLILFPAAEA